MFNKTAIVVMLFALCLSANNGYAQQAVSSESTTTTATSTDVDISDDGLVSLDFRDADIRNVLKILAFKSGVNIVASPQVTGLVTIQLSNVPWEEALDVILETYGFASDKRGSIIVVTTIEDLKKRREDAVILSEQEPVETQTYVLNFAEAQNVVPALDRMKSDRGAVDYDDRTNTVIVTDIQSKQKLIQQVIKRLDKTTDQVLIEAKIVETQFTDQENLGIDWVTQVTLSGSARPVTWPFHGNDSKSQYLPDDFPGADEDEFSYGTLSFSQTSAVFELLKTKTDTDILSNPRIVTLDNQPAKIVVGEQYPLPQYTYNEEQDALQISGWEYLDVGIIFNVTPHVNDAGFVTLDVSPEITEISSFVTVENTSVPRITTETTSTSVMIEDGATLVIGGLVKSKVTDTKKRTPIFGDIPVIGYAFRKSEVTTTKTDILIFITPHIVTPKVASAE